MATYVLVHGAWHGGWCWRKVTPLLRAAGHEVYTPTLTGLGERAHLLTPEVDLETHIQDVLNVLEYEDLHDVVLVGHSYGGMVITGVAAHTPERLAQLVYLDAFIPKAGECLLDLLAPERRAHFVERARESGDQRVPSPPLGGFGVTDPADLAWAEPRIEAQPRKTFDQPVPAPAAGEAATPPRTYIWCAQSPNFARFAEQTRDDPSWRYRELATGHDAMITAPDALATLLLEMD